jgi:hypothetical protein
MSFRKLPIVVIAFSLTLAGCGAGKPGTSNSPQSPPSNFAPSEISQVSSFLSTDSDVTRAYGANRGIQSVFWLALDSNFASNICDTLNTAPADKRITIEMSLGGAYDGGSGKNPNWTNAQTAIEKLSGHGLDLVIDFGHHKMAQDQDKNEDRNAQMWGAQLATGLFNENYNKAIFILQVANEDKYDNTDWKDNLINALTGLTDTWNKFKNADGKNPFPYSNIRIRRTPTKDGATVPSTIPFKGHTIKVSGEYHFPENGSISVPSNTPVVSNDGQLVVDSSYDNVKAKHNGTPLERVSLARFKREYGKYTLLLWHPALHKWRYDGIYYQYPSDRENASGDNQKKFLALLKAFMES